MLSVDNERRHGYGFYVNVGYRHYFNRLVLSGALFSGFEYSFERNDLFTFRSREVVPIGVRVTIGLALGR